VVDALSNSSTATLGEVRSYLLTVLQAESELTEQEQQLIDKYRLETERIRSQINSIQTRLVAPVTHYDVMQDHTLIHDQMIDPFRFSLRFNLTFQKFCSSPVLDKLCTFKSACRHA
jgi:putative hemolysin